MRKILAVAAVGCVLSTGAMASDWVKWGTTTFSNGETCDLYTKDRTWLGKRASVNVFFACPVLYDMQETLAFYCGQPHLFKSCSITGGNCTDSMPVRPNSHAEALYKELCG